jgi:hypothetical protein
MLIIQDGVTQILEDFLIGIEVTIKNNLQRKIKYMGNDDDDNSDSMIVK